MNYKRENFENQECLKSQLPYRVTTLKMTSKTVLRL